jgi:hypothetical protein
MTSAYLRKRPAAASHGWIGGWWSRARRFKPRGKRSGGPSRQVISHALREITLLIGVRGTNNKYASRNPHRKISILNQKKKRFNFFISRKKNPEHQKLIGFGQPVSRGIDWKWFGGIPKKIGGPTSRQSHPKISGEKS